MASFGTEDGASPSFFNVGDKRSRGDGEDSGTGGGLQRRRFIMEQEFGPAEPEPEEEWENCPFDETEHQREYVHGACWACRHGNLIEDQEKHPAHFALFKLLSQYYGKMHNDELFEAMNAHFENYIRQPILADGGDCMEWPVKVIKEHVLKHMNDPTIAYCEQIKVLSTLERLLKEKITIRNKNTGEMQHDLKVIDKLLQVQKNIRELHNAKPNKGWLYDNTLKMGSDDT